MAVCREKGVVIVKASGSGAVSISNGGNTVAPGTYKDRLTGNTWTVTSSNISGSIGSTGIAVVYNFDESTLPDLPSGGTSGGTEKEFTAYFDNTVSNWSSVFAYAWNPNDNSEMLGAWPGSDLSIDSKSGYFVATASTNVTSPMIIFNNGQGGGGSNQTGDLVFINNGVYNYNGYQYTGVECIESSNMTIYAAAGVLYVISPIATTMKIVRADGVVMYVSVQEGVNAIDHLERGFYIVERHKVIL
jgi:alpha-amylase